MTAAVKKSRGRPRVAIPAELYDLARAIADLKEVGDPRKGVPTEPERHPEGFVSGSPDADAFRRWARAKVDEIRKYCDRTARDVDHRIWCRPEDYDGKDECPTCLKPLRRRKPLRQVADDDGSITRAD